MLAARICLPMLLALLPTLALAQTVYNPTRIEFLSPDHDTNVSEYVVEYWLNGVDPAVGQPYTVATLPKAAVTLSSGTYQAALTSLTPLPAIQVGQTYKATLIAVGLDTTQRSARSSLSNPFAKALAPAPPQSVSFR